LGGKVTFPKLATRAGLRQVKRDEWGLGNKRSVIRLHFLVIVTGRNYQGSFHLQVMDVCRSGKGSHKSRDPIRAGSMVVLGTSLYLQTPLASRHTLRFCDYFQ